MDLSLHIKTLPNQPGVYQYYDRQGKILYVGKAKNLRKRVASYFTKNHDNAKTRVLVKKIARIEHIVVETETDALLLENNLIKKYQPRYNVMLKDDKTYPWICIKKEPFPRVFLTRKVLRDGATYFGPYASVRTARVLLDLIRELYPLRTCTYDLRAAHIAEKKYKLCLDYHIGNCKAPCEGLQEAADYDQGITAIRKILKGDCRHPLNALRQTMIHCAEKEAFEAAQRIKEKIERLSNYQAKSTVISPTISNVDVFSIVSDVSAAYVNFLKISNGAIIQSHTAEIKKKLDESDQQLLEFSIVEIRRRFHSQSPEIFVPFEVDLGEQLKVTIPKLGDKKRIVDLSLRNAKYYRIERIKQLKIVDPERHVNRLLVQLKKDLRLSEIPGHIECFDNSNTQGTNPVAACVVFKNAKPSKKEYRHFNIKTVTGPDDFASMEEVVFRRYKRLLQEDGELPQLIVIDGGKGQLSAALKSLELLGLRNKIAIIGIAKRLEEIYYPNDPVPLYLDKRSESLKIIQQLRNEAHRFGITHHRKKRSQGAFEHELTQISGIGKQTIRALLIHFKSAKRVSVATEEEIAKVIGQKRAGSVYDYYHKRDDVK